MNINKVGEIGPLYNQKKVNKTNEIPSVNFKQDKIEISEEARIQNLLNYIKESNNSDEERLEKLQKIKEKLKSGFYENLNEEVLTKIADNLYDTSKEFLIDLTKEK
ncbi:MAG: flagellar biosynthesis anti-sigma factor FlgM [Leptonema sp. (in: bacteria)]